MNLQNGAFGDPSRIETLILFWTKMEMLHYPGAAETKSYLEGELKRQEEAQMQQLMQQRLAQLNEKNPTMQQSAAAPQLGQMDPAMLQAVVNKAKQDAARAAAQGTPSMRQPG